MKKLTGNSAGDTIVEVMIAIAIASFVIAGAYTITNRSLGDTQQAEEHAEALQIANSQVELVGHYLRISSQTTLGTYMYNSRFHCFNPTTAQIETLSNIGSLPDPNPSDYDDLSVPGPDCSNTGTVAYRVAFEYVAGPTHVDDVYNVYVNWDGIHGGTDQVKVVYKAGL